MQDGTLHKTENGWVVAYDQIAYTPVGDHDYKVTRKGTTLPTHPDHNLWLKVFGEEGAPVCFEVDTIAAGTSEWDVMDADVAHLKACGPDTHVYTQD